jgi:hypothetical protein
MAAAFVLVVFALIFSSSVKGKMDTEGGFI